MPGSPPHGFALSPEDDRLLRAPPPQRTLRWCAAATGSGARVIHLEAMAGGTSSAVHAVGVEDARGRVSRLVLRRFVRSDWLAEEPDAPRREARALEVARDCPVPTPRLVALDPTGEATDAPALLMTRLAGSVDWRPRELDPYLRRLASALPVIHATALPRRAAIPAYAPYRPHPTRPPSWASRPGLWERAFEVLARPAPRSRRCFIHRDYHPGNVLWAEDGLGGVVDWVNASVGAPDADVGHCRMNLAGAIGIEAAERFLELHRDVAGRGDYHPYWDIAAALGGFGDAELEGWSARDEEFLLRAVARL